MMLRCECGALLVIKCAGHGVHLLKPPNRTGLCERCAKPTGGRDRRYCAKCKRKMRAVRPHNVHGGRHARQS